MWIYLLNLFLLIPCIISVELLLLDSKPNKIKLEQKNKKFDLIHINFICDQENNNKSCNKARKAIDNAAIIINNTFDLRAPIIINASFIPICNTIEQCYNGQPEPLGAAKPSKFISLLDNDG